MSKLADKVRSKISMDMHNPYYHTQEDYIEDLTKFKNAVKEKHGLDLTIEQCCTIWEKFSGSWSASFMCYQPSLVDTALEEYLSIK